MPPVIRLMETGLAPVAAPLLPEDLIALGLDRAGSRKNDSAPRNAAERPTDCVCLPPVHACGAATSSMDVAHALAASGDLPPWGSVIAASQTAGKGQLGRTWLSPRGNIYAALRLPAVPPFTHTAAAPAVGGLMAQALNAALGPAGRVRMKWPNDIVAFVPSPAPDRADARIEAETPLAEPRPESRQESDQGPCTGQPCGCWRKLGGILIEERRDVVIAGIGLNLISAPPDTVLRPEHALPAGALALIFPCRNTGDPNRIRPAALWKRLAASMFLQYNTWGCSEDWLDLAERHLAFRGRTVLLVEDEGQASGLARGVLDGLDASGGLRLSLLSPAGGERARPQSRVFLSGGLRLPPTDDAPSPGN